MSSTKPSVLLIGSTGRTGSSITRPILESEIFRLAVLARPESAAKPEYEQLRVQGVEIRVGDIDDSHEQLKKYLDGVDILVSAVAYYAVPKQRGIIRAAKEVGVKRIVPCDFATPGAKSVRDIHDTKFAIHEFIQEIGVPYTFIDVGWWMQFILPLPLRADSAGTSLEPEAIQEIANTIVRDGTARNLLTDYRHIGIYVVRILADPRTINHSVIIWEDEVTQLQTHEIAEGYSGAAEELKVRRIYRTEEDIIKTIAEAKELQAKHLNNPELLHKIGLNQYMLNMFVLRENTLDNAKKLGYLDVRELYPDIKPSTLEDFAKEFYAKSLPVVSAH
ncbi:NAD(P)-binding protein [Fomes fomentarius]|nr:NAD(P)-binding protein [Fomes fomentarius]